MKPFLKIALHVIVFTFLTIITQIGGIIYLVAFFLAKKQTYILKYSLLIIFPIVYLFATFLVIPFVAPLFGRERVLHSETIKPSNYTTVLLNRNYVRPKLNKLLTNTSKNLKGIKIHYLDANFPFVNKFPLLPHLSHNDGKKIDLSLIYETLEGVISPCQKSVSGYGVFEAPKNNESNQIEKCKTNGYFQYDYPKYLTFGKINSSLNFSKVGTRALIHSLLKNNSLEKLFIEPHLKQRLDIQDSRVRYHGCRAVRHDDHIHIQVK